MSDEWTCATCEGVFGDETGEELCIECQESLCPACFSSYGGLCRECYVLEKNENDDR